MIRTLLVDDELKALEVLKQKLVTYCPEIEIIGTADSADKAFDLIASTRPQLVFMDVAMPKENGFDLLRRLPHLDFELIFVTGFDNYAIDAIKFCAIGYVLKPIENGELIDAVKKAERRILEKINQERNQQFLNNLLNPGNSQNKIGIPTESGLEFISTEEIVQSDSWLKVYPNPVLDNLSIEVSNLNNYEVQLIDIHGKVHVQGSNVNQLSLSSLPSGIYFLNLYNEQFQFLQNSKLIKLE